MGSLVYVPRLNASVKVCQGSVLWARGLCIWGQRVMGVDWGEGVTLAAHCFSNRFDVFPSKCMDVNGFGYEWACGLHSVMWAFSLVTTTALRAVRSRYSLIGDGCS